MVLDAVERLGIEPSFCAGHSLGEYTALTATGALGFDDGVRLVVERADAMHDAGARAARARWPPCSASTTTRSRSPAAAPTRDVWVANYNAPGQVVIAGSPDGVAAASAHAKELGAKKVMPLPVSRRVPHAVHGPGPRPAARRRSPTPTPATPRCPVVVQRRRPPPPRAARSGRACCRPSCRSPVRWKHCLLDARRPRRHRLRRARPRRRAHRHGQAHRRPAPARSRSPRPTTSTSCSSGSGAGRADRGRRSSRASTSSPPSASSSARRPASSRRPPSIADGRARSTVGDRARPRRRARGPLAVRRRAAELHRRRRRAGHARQPIAWLRTS